MNKRISLFVAIMLIASASIAGQVASYAATIISLDDLVVVIPGTSRQPNQTEALPFLRGVNLAGAEFGPVAYPATYGRDYIYPNQDEVDYFLAKGMRLIRLPFTWERLQHSTQAEFDSIEQ